MNKPLLIVVEDNPSIDSYSARRILEFSHYYNIQQEYMQKIVRSDKKYLDFCEQYFKAFKTKLEHIKSTSLVAIVDLNLNLAQRDYLEMINTFSPEIISFLEFWKPDKHKINISNAEGIVKYLNEHRLLSDLYKSLGGLCLALTILKNKNIDFAFIDIASSNDTDAKIVVDFLKKELINLGRSEVSAYIKRNREVWTIDTRIKILEENYREFFKWGAPNSDRSFERFSNTLKKEAIRRDEGIHINSDNPDTANHYQYLADYMDWELGDLISNLELKKDGRFVTGHIVNECLKAFADAIEKNLTLLGVFIICWAYCRKHFITIDNTIHNKFLDSYKEKILIPYKKNKKADFVTSFSRTKNLLPCKNEQDYIRTIQSLEDMFEAILVTEKRDRLNIDSIELRVDENSQKFALHLTNIVDCSRLIKNLILYNKSSTSDVHPQNSTSGKIFDFYLNFQCGSTSDNYLQDTTVYGSKGVFRIEKPATSNHRINIIFEI